jgi:Cu/Ag efflux protein CusF
MKTSVLKITALSLFAAALVAAPASVRADETTNAPASGQEAPAKPKRATLPFHGKLSALDTNAMTMTVGTRTFEITSETKITKDNLPATLEDGVVGEMVGGAYKKSADGKLSATTVHFGLKSGEANAEGKKKKKAAVESAETSTNSVTK